MSTKERTFTAGGITSRHSIPGAYSRNTSAGRQRGTVSISNLVFLGTSLGGGEPGKLIVFDDPEVVTESLIGGSAVDIIRESFVAGKTPEGDDLRPQEIGYIRVNSATQSVAVLQDVGTNDIIDLTSVDYGAYTQQISYKLEDGVAVGTKAFGEKYKGVENISDDILKQSLSIIYTGAGTGAQVDVTATALTTSVAGGPGGEDLNFLFTDYPTIGEMVDAINGSAGGVYTAVQLTNRISDQSDEMDILAAGDIKSGAIILVSNVQALIDAINNSMDRITAVLSDGAERVFPEDISEWTRLTGGTDGVSTVTEWTAALIAAETEDIQLIGIDNTDTAVVALLKAHVLKMNSVDGKKERQTIVGADANFDSGLTQAVGLNNEAVNLCWMQYRNRNFNSVETDFEPEHYAAKLLGQASALALNEALTFKQMDVIENYTKLTTTQIKSAIKAGLIVPETTDDGITRTVRSISTDQSEDLKKIEFSMVRERFYMARDLRTAIETLVTGKGGTGGKVVSVDSLFLDKMRTYEDTDEVITADPDNPLDNPAWRDYSRTLNGDVLNVKWKGNVVAPINFSFIENEFDILVSLSQS